MTVAVERKSDSAKGHDGENAGPSTPCVDAFDPESITEVPDIQAVVKDFEDEVRGIHPCCLLVPDIRLRDFKGLVGSIAKLGLTEAIKVDQEKRLVDGRCRLRACYLTGVKPRFETLQADTNAWLVATSNLTRRNLTKGQRAAFADSLRERFDQAAKQRQRKRKAGLKQQGVEIFHTLSIDLDHPAKARDQVGQIAGVSGKSVDKFRKIKKADPELAAEVANGELSLHAAYQQLPSPCAKSPNSPCTKKPDQQSLDTDDCAPLVEEPSVSAPAEVEQLVKSDTTPDPKNDKTDADILYDDDSVIVLGRLGKTKKRVIIGRHQAGWWIYPSDKMDSRYRFDRSSREKAIVMAEKILEAKGRLVNKKHKT